MSDDSPSSVSDLAAFLRARLDEEATDATDYHDARRCGSLDRDGGFDLEWCDCGYPARLLREVAAKRAILAYAESGAMGWGQWHEIAVLLAAVYSDHPDYDQAWKVA